MSGFFSSPEDLSIPFYNEEFENELLSSVGLGESVVASSGAPPDAMSLALEDPCYFVDYAEEGQDFFPTIDFDLTDYVLSPASPADVKPEVKEPVQAVHRYEPYPEPSREARKKRGRPMKNGSSSKMANYSRQYREMKKSQLAASEEKIQELENENAELRAQVQQLTMMMKKLESEVKRTRSHHQPYVQSVPVLAVDQHY